MQLVGHCICSMYSVHGPLKFQIDYMADPMPSAVAVLAFSKVILFI